MASVAISELVQESHAWIDSTGYHAVRAFIVTGLTSTTGPTLQAIVGVTGLPAYGEPHPNYPLIFATEIDSKPFKNSRTEARVVITYNGPSGNNTADTVITWTGHTQEARTNFDEAGDLIRVIYSSTGDNAVSIPEVGLVTGVRACGILTFEFSTAEDPENQYAFLGGAVNSGDWRGGAAYTWMFENPAIQKAKFIPGWRVSLSARYDPQTHLKTAFWRDPHGIIPSDIDRPVVMTPGATGNGWTTVLPFGTFLLNFNNVTVPGV